MRRRDTDCVEAGEQAGHKLAYGCGIGMCHTCVGTLKSGKVRDLRSPSRRTVVPHEFLAMATFHPTTTGDMNVSPASVETWRCCTGRQGGSRARPDRS